MPIMTISWLSLGNFRASGCRIKERVWLWVHLIFMLLIFIKIMSLLNQCPGYWIKIPSSRDSMSRTLTNRLAQLSFEGNTLMVLAVYCSWTGKMVLPLKREYLPLLITRFIMDYFYELLHHFFYTSVQLSQLVR